MSCNKECNTFFLDTFQWWFVLDDEVYKWIDKKSQLTTWPVWKLIYFTKVLFIVKEFSHSLHFVKYSFIIKFFAIWDTFRDRKLLHFMLKSCCITIWCYICFTCCYILRHKLRLFPPPPTITTSPTLFFVFSLGQG